MSPARIAFGVVKSARRVADYQGQIPAKTGQAILDSCLDLVSLEFFGVLWRTPMIKRVLASALAISLRGRCLI